MLSATNVAYPTAKLSCALPRISAVVLRQELRTALLLVATGLYHKTISGSPADQTAFAGRGKSANVQEHIAALLHDQTTLALVAPALSDIVEREEYRSIDLAIESYLKIREID